MSGGNPTAGPTAGPTVGVIGTGAMGRGIVQIMAAGGCRVKMFDANQGASADAGNFVEKMLLRAAEKGAMSEEDAKEAVERIEIASDKGGLKDCDIVVEAIVEQLEPKQALFKELEGIVSKDCILASNTSSLSVTAIGALCEHRGRVAGFHFFNPVPLMKIVEVIPGLQTDEKTLDILTKAGERAGHAVVRAKDTPGFLINHIGRGFGTEGLRIHGEGVASFADIDAIMRECAGFRMGPFQLMDLTGIDVSDPVMKSIYHQYFEEPRFRPSVETGRRVAAGLYGRKTGQGFYPYPDGKMKVDAPVIEAAKMSGTVWVSKDRPGAGKAVSDLLRGGDIAVSVHNEAPPDGLCVVTPLGEDATTCALRLGLDPARTIAIDTVFGLDARITCMGTPLTPRAALKTLGGALKAAGHEVALISDSPGFIAPRILACIVNIASDIAQQGIASPADIDLGAKLGLGYPKGPLEWGDEIGPSTILEILKGLQTATGDPRYRPSLWLSRRARLGVSLKTPNMADKE